MFFRKKAGDKMINKEYSGDFMQFDCPKCFHTVRVTIKNGEESGYYCSYCGERIENE